MKFKEISQDKILDLLEEGEVLYVETETPEENETTARAAMTQYCMLEATNAEKIYLTKMPFQKTWIQFFDIPLDNLLDCIWLIEYDEEDE